MATPSLTGEAPWIGEVLAFWFHELTAEQWFKKDPTLDARIAARFLDLHERVASGREAIDRNSARAMLAAIVVLDQFPRNMFRGTARAFASDRLALDLARAAVDGRLDHGLADNERLFLYLPFEHSEDATDQARSVALFEALGNRDWLNYAIAHKVIIDRFGRFPHRNAALARPSTAEETEFLKHTGSGF